MLRFTEYEGFVAQEGLLILQNSTEGMQILGININIVSAIVGAIVGAALGLLTSVLLNYLQRRNRRSSVREAFRSELTSVSPLLYTHASRANTRNVTSDIEIPVDPFVSTVYEANAGELGLLSKEEVTALTDYYTLAESISRRIQAYEEMSEIPIGTARKFQNDLATSNNKKNTAVELLSRKLGRDFERTGEYADLDIEKADLSVIAKCHLSVSEEGEER